MAENSKIEWTTHTFNPWIGCTKVSSGCDSCYAEAMMDKRWGRVKWGPHGERVRTSDGNWHGPVKWAGQYRRQVELFDEGMLTLPPPRPRVFCASLADVFDNQVPPEWRADLFQLIHDTPELDWLLLTKRPENIRKLGTWPTLPWRNIWLGFTAEDQENFDRRWAVVEQIPAVVRFCSYEPALGPLRIWRTSGPPNGLHWLICGGESGTGHRGMDMAWERDVRMDCERAGISYFFKQMAGKRPFPEGFQPVRQFPHPVS